MTSAVQILAGLPTLPMGKGPLILILGGLFALGMSLVWTFLFPREAPMSAYTYGYTPQPLQHPAGGGSVGAAVALSPPAQASPLVVGETHDDSWLLDASEVTERMGFGPLVIISSRPNVYRVQLEGCESCSYRAARTVGCEVERQALECAVEAFVEAPVVTEASCAARREGPCVFEIRTGGRR